MDLSLILQKKSIFVPIIPHGISPPRQAFQPILIQIVSRPGSGAYLKSLWQRCHSLYRFGVQSRRSRFLRKYHYHLQIIAPGNAGSRLAHCLIAVSWLRRRLWFYWWWLWPFSLDGHGDKLLRLPADVCLRYCLFSCQGADEDRISSLVYIVFESNNRKNHFCFDKYSVCDNLCPFAQKFIWIEVLDVILWLTVFIKCHIYKPKKKRNYLIFYILWYNNIV